jgi:hypothetical protein
LRAREKTAIVVSPWLTVEEGELVRELAELCGARASFVSPPESPLKDDLLHTGDPCPNRRGLAELGLAAETAEEALARLGEAQSALVLGERVVELLGGSDALGTLPRSLRAVVVDTRAPKGHGARVVAICIGAPNAVERTGTWINVDGIRRPLAVAKPAPPGVAQLVRTLRGLRDRLAPAEVEA